ncbi:DUF2339 domain-containing protein [Cohnella faecalis]|uniref:DUF2339 domain-containing protein n=1 Tax=Cohnella faecalis TaxID=2315694 RepID=A0A398CI15_9BACL|nr:DUF2339 domain-containing protein [Cohnella faecalis]RIE00789.1 DUF2339 domain-containing protein [Cohnella faecalis]
MNSNIRKHWTSLVGVLFVVAAFVTFFRYSIDQGWVSDAMKIGAGLVVGVGLALGGLSATVRSRQSVVSEIVIGTGACILFATFSFAGIFYDMWPSITVLIAMGTVTALVSAYAFRFDSRLLMNIALAGGLVSPMLMQPETDQVFTLFLFLLVLNAAYFFLSVAKRWSELRIAAFGGTWVLYAIYFVKFQPLMEGLWSMPIRYAFAAFVLYIAGFLYASWGNNRCFDGWNLYLSLTNGVLFGCWALYIWNGDVPAAATVAMIGAIYLIAGAFVYKMTGKAALYSLSHGFGGALLLLIAAAQTGAGLESKPLINVYLWSAVVVALIGIGRNRRLPILQWIAIPIWVVVCCYWFAVTWDTPRGEWFGVYIPFLNWGAISWIVLAAIGFYLAKNPVGKFASVQDEKVLANLYALLSHIIIGGLLTVQIENVFEEYVINPSGASLLQISLSVAWGVYAVLLFLWGSYNKQKLFVWFGSVVLVIVAVKAIFFDLSGEETLYKVLAMLLLGLLSFLISWVNGKWGGKQTASETPLSSNDSDTGVSP